jgi:hypothetical protein
LTDPRQRSWSHRGASSGVIGEASRGRRSSPWSRLVDAQLINGVRMSTDLSLFGHLSRPQTMARPASFGGRRHMNRFPSLGSPRTPTYTPTPTTRGGTRRHEAPQLCRDRYSGRHLLTPDNTSNGALKNRAGRQALGGSNPSPSAVRSTTIDHRTKPRQNLDERCLFSFLNQRRHT